MTYPEFYDSYPGDQDNIPGNYPRGAKYAALYADTSLEPGYRPQPNPGVPNVRYITRRGGDEAAAYAGLADFERGNLVDNPLQLQTWAEGRVSRGLRFRVYCSRSGVKLAYPLVKTLNPLWWIATLDNDSRWDPASIVSSVRAVTGVTLDPESVWGIQWGTGPWDTSYLTGEW